MVDDRDGDREGPLRTTRVLLTEDTSRILGPEGERRPAQGETDWPRVDAMSDEDIAQAAATDPDARLLTPRELAEAQKSSDVDVRSIRRKQELSQVAFATHYGFPLQALREWEEGLRPPSRLARLLLKVIEYEPEAVERVLVRV